MKIITMSNSEGANAVTITPPDFMETSVPSWFEKLEAQFHLRNITAEKTMFYSVIATLPSDVMSKLPRAITSASQSNYDILKDAVINMYEKTKPELLDRLMRTTSISGRPSAYLREMISTAERIGVTDDIIRHKFLQALPPTISPVIASQKDLSLIQLGNLADELLPYFSRSTVMAVQPPHVQVQPTATTIPQPQVHPSPQNFPGNTNHGNYNQSLIPIGVRSFNRNQRPKVCRAHVYFAENARTCKPWCKWPNRANCKMLPNSRPASPAPSEN